MPTENETTTKGTCFVVMGFGKKTDFESGRTLDLDKSYRNIIKPAVQDAGLQCIRADEIVHSGMIDVPMYEQLLNADVVVADLSTSNKNAFYELGIRHALRPFTTIVIAEDGIKSPFDVNHIVIRQYHHLGEDIGFDEAMRFRKELAEAIKEIMAKEPRAGDSPVYRFITNLKPPGIEEAVQEAVAQIQREAVAPVQDAAQQATAMTHSLLMQQVDAAQKNGDWILAKTLLNTVIAMQGGEKAKDPYLLQRLALVTYKSKQPTEIQALDEACKILQSLSPETSNDTETLGLWGAVHKRLWQLTKTQYNLNEAVRAYERAFYLRNDYYNGINFAFLLNERASVLPDPAWAIADYMQARRIREEVVAICKKWIDENPNPHPELRLTNVVSGSLHRVNWYWLLASMAEAYVGLEKEEEAGQLLEELYQKAPQTWMKETTEEQIKKLQQLLKASPLRFLQGSPPSLVTE